MNEQVNDFKEKFFPNPDNLGKEYNPDPPKKRRSIFFKVFSYSNIRIYFDIWIFPIEPEAFAWTLLRALHIWILSVLCMCVFVCLFIFLCLWTGNIVFTCHLSFLITPFLQSQEPASYWNELFPDKPREHTVMLTLLFVWTNYLR